MSTADVISICNVIAAIGVGVAIVIATFRGPIVATQAADKRREEAERRAHQMQVFRKMMGHRFDVKHPNFVSGLNLIQIEFANNKEVLEEFYGFLDAFHGKHKDRPDWLDMQRKAIVRLLSAIGRALGYDLKELDLMDQVYSPKLWADTAEQQQAILKLLADVASGTKGFPVLNLIPDVFLEDVGDGKFAIKVKQEK